MKTRYVLATVVEVREDDDRDEDEDEEDVRENFDMLPLGVTVLADFFDRRKKP